MVRIRNTHARLGCALLVLALASVACGGGKDPAGLDTPGENAAQSEGQEPGAPTSVPGSDGSSATASPGGKEGGGATGGSPSTVAGGAPAAAATPDNSELNAGRENHRDLRLTAELKEACVRPGGSQTITIKSEPESGVGYDTVYSDGNSGVMGDHYGGNKVTTLDASGQWTDTWVVSAKAPAGRTQVNVLATKVDYKVAQATLFFNVADALGNCS